MNNLADLFQMTLSIIISSEYNDWISKRYWCTIIEPELTITVVRFNVILDSKNLVTYPLRKGYFHSFFDSHLFDSKLNSSTSSVWWLAMQKIKDWLQWKRNENFPSRNSRNCIRESTYKRKQMDDFHKLRVSQPNDYDDYHQLFCLQSLQ